MVVVAIAVLLLVQGIVRKPRSTPMRPAPDLLRLEFPTAGVTVSEHTPEHLEVVTDQWMLVVNATDSRGADTVMGVIRKSIARLPNSREDVLTARDAPTVYRFLTGVQEPHHAARADYVISVGDAWALANAYPRNGSETFDVTPVDRLLLASRLAKKPRPKGEVAPAWRAYQASRKPGSPVAKFVLSIAPAPLRLGNHRTRLGESSYFTKADFRRGGRQVTPDLIEFYTRDDPFAIRVDVWLDRQPAVEGREAIFDARLRVEPASLGLWSSDEPLDVPVPPGEYDVSISLVNRGKTTDPSLTDDEWFRRDELERYEILLTRRREE